jgi:hypothetical protein
MFLNSTSFKFCLFFFLWMATTPISAQLNFSDVTSLLQYDGVRSSHPMTIVDVNGDKLDDVVRLANGFDLYVAFQQTDGTFIEIHIADFSELGNTEDAWGMCAADVDGNGICEIAFGGYYDDIKIVTPGSVDDDYEYQNAPGLSIFVQAMAFADIDNDGHIDLIACHDDGPSKVLMNNGDGTFEEDYSTLQTNIYPTQESNAGNYGIVWSDVNNDGRLDCYIAKCRQGVNDPTDVRRINQLHIRNEDGTYTEMAESFGLDDGAQSWSADFGDIDNDGDQDVFIGNHDMPSKLMLNNGDGTFTNISTEAGLNGFFNFLVIQSTLRDFDNNGFLDILATGGGNFRLMLNNGDNTFTESDFGSAISVNSYALGDINNDGFIDFISTEGGYGGVWGMQDPDLLMLNDGNDNNYVTFNLEGTESNPNGIGAKIEISGPWGMMVREIKAGESYGIMNSLQAHFGLGEATAIDQVSVYWPSGIVDVISNPEINANHVIVEGESSTGINNPVEATFRANVFPNPMTTYSTLDISEYNFAEGNPLLEIYSVNGKLVRTEQIKENMHTISRGNLSEGMYQIRISIDGSKLATTSLFVK